ncbi:MAG TPA: phasin family protein [Bauldia sp.]|nr:phasin family protein [Bauldia sp.]
MMNGFDDFQKLGRDNVEATMKSASAVGKGWQALAAEVADYSRQSLESGSAAFEKLLGVTSLDKAMEVQSEFARTAYEGYVNQVTKVGTIVSDIAKDAYKPFEGLFGRAVR